jgi:hypothetical protein
MEGRGIFELVLERKGQGLNNHYITVKVNKEGRQLQLYR